MRDCIAEHPGSFISIRALSACTCMCGVAEPHLLQARILQADAVAKAALTFLCTQPHHCISAFAETCHAMMMLHACRPKVETLAEHHAHLPARQPHVARIAEQGTQGACRPILSTKPPDQHHACLVSIRMHVRGHTAHLLES